MEHFPDTRARRTAAPLLSRPNADHGDVRKGLSRVKFLTWRGRFPRIRLELPPDAVEHVAKQVAGAASELAFDDFTSRAAKRHRSELRDLTGWRECTKTDQETLVSHLADVIWHAERREEQVRAELLRQMRAETIEPPTAAQIDTVIRSALHQADEPVVVMRTVYEACVFQALRDRLRCKEIWVVGADKWRNPDDDPARRLRGPARRVLREAEQAA